MTTSTLAASTLNRTRPLWQRGLLGGLLAAVLNLVLLWIAQAVLGVIELPMPPDNATVAPLTWGQVVVASFVPAVFATVLYWLSLRFVRNGRRAFLLASIIFLLLSLFGPLSLPVTASVKSVLILMHAIAGASILGVLLR